MGYAVQASVGTTPLRFLMVSSADHISGATGLSPAVVIAKITGGFAAPLGAVSEIGSGWYQVAGNGVDTNTVGPLLLHATAGGADPTDEQYDIVNFNPSAAPTPEPTVSISSSSSANTFLQITRSLRLYCPQLPISLAEQLIRDRYRRILERRNWSATRVESEFQLGNAKIGGTVTWTYQTNVVIGSGTSFSATDVNRQFKAGTGSPIYTIVAVDPVNQILTLDRNIGIATPSTPQTYFVADCYVSPPSNFLQFIVVSDPLQGIRLRHWVTAGEMAGIDPQRTFMGQPYVLADRLYNLQGTPQFECWPYNTTQRTLYYIYIARPPDLINDNDTPIWPIRSDVIVSGALADMARWPGTQEQPNPYFTQPNMWGTYDREYEDKMIEIERRDEDVYLTMLQSSEWSNYPLAPSATYVQSHAI